MFEARALNEKARIESQEKVKPDLELEIQKELKELRAQLEEVTEGEEDDPVAEIKKELAKLRKELDSTEN